MYSFQVGGYVVRLKLFMAWQGGQVAGKQLSLKFEFKLQLLASVNKPLNFNMWGLICKENNVIKK